MGNPVVKCCPIVLPIEFDADKKLLGIHNKVFYAMIDGRVMLIRNLKLPYGLTNGAVSIINVIFIYVSYKQVKCFV